MARVPALPATAALLALVSCGTRPPLPELPAVNPDAFLPAVRDTVSAAAAEARATPEDAQANGRLGMLLHAHDQPSAASAAYRRAWILDPKNFAWPYYLALTESTQGNYDAAGKAIDEALAIDPEYLPAVLKRAEILFDQGKLDEAEAIYSAAAPEHPDSAFAWYGLGRVQAAKGETAKAAESLEKACAIYPQFGTAHYALSQALRKLGRNEEAQSHLEPYTRFKTWYPNAGDRYLQDVLSLNISAVTFIRRGSTMEAAGDLAGAIEMHLKAIEADPRSAQAFANLISLYGRSGRNEDAASVYRSAVAIEPGHAEAHYNYGVLMFNQKRFAEGRKAFERALASNPNYAEAHNNLAFLLETEGKQAAAIEHYRQAVAAQPRFRLAHFHLGRILTNQRRFAEAIPEFEKTLEPVDDQTPGFLYGLGAAHGRAGHREQAVEYLTRARQMAAERNQPGLRASIERDLRTLGALP
ncbi:MAG: tetratricopeptide repeat protein [Bryobacteraceae bacterium]